MPPRNPPGVNISVTWKMIWALIVAGLGGIATIIWVLVSLVYGGLKEEIKDTKISITTLSNSYSEAVTSGVKVQDLITRAPTLERTINETHDAVIRLQGSMDLLNPLETHDAIIELKPVPRQLNEIKKQLDNIAVSDTSPR
jgi:hypothetical protein